MMLPQICVACVLGTINAPIRPPRLVTSEPVVPAAELVSEGPGTLLMIVATLGIALTVAWWIWWAIRYQRAKYEPRERVYRTLASRAGLGPKERELLRQRASESGRDPIEVIVTGVEVEDLFRGHGEVGARIIHAIGDTSEGMKGTP